MELLQEHKDFIDTITKNYGAIHAKIQVNEKKMKEVQEDLDLALNLLEEQRSIENSWYDALAEAYQIDRSEIVAICKKYAMLKINQTHDESKEIS